MRSCLSRIHSSKVLISRFGSLRVGELNNSWSSAGQGGVRVEDEGVESGRWAGHYLKPPKP